MNLILLVIFIFVVSCIIGIVSAMSGKIERM